jgi:hypothetical protein
MIFIAPARPVDLFPKSVATPVKDGDLRCDRLRSWPWPPVTAPAT